MGAAAWRGLADTLAQPSHVLPLSHCRDEDVWVLHGGPICVPHQLRSRTLSSYTHHTVVSTKVQTLRAWISKRVCSQRNCSWKAILHELSEVLS